VLSALWWNASLRANKFYGRGRVWFPAYHYLAIDFLHNYYSARYWLAGGDPYEGVPISPLPAGFCYAPVVLPLFAWCGLVSPWTATIIWVGALAACAVLGSWASWRVRRRLGLAELPLLLVVGSVLLSTPVLF